MVNSNAKVTRSTVKQDDRGKSTGANEYWDRLFAAIKELTEAGEITWVSREGDLMANLELRTHEGVDEKDEEVVAMSVLKCEEDEPGDETAFDFSSPEALSLHKTVRDKYGYGDEQN